MGRRIVSCCPISSFHPAWSRVVPCNPACPITAGSTASAAPLTIMPVGDSITVGMTDNPTWSVPYDDGYRGDLYQSLSAAGYNIQYVGDSPQPWNGASGTPTNTPAFDLRSINQDHFEAYTGVTTSFIQANIGGWLTTYSPDVVLLDIGINDVGNNPYVDPVGAEANLLSIVQTFVADDPAGHLIVAQITPFDFYTPGIVDYNAWIANTLVPEYAADNVTSVDLYDLMLVDGAPSPSMYANGVNHPTAANYQLIADAEFNGITSIISVPEPSVSLLLLAALPLRRKSRRPSAAAAAGMG